MSGDMTRSRDKLADYAGRGPLAGMRALITGGESAPVGGATLPG